MEKVEKKIIQVFQNKGIARNGTLPIQSLQSELNNWNRGDRDQAEDAIENLINEGFLEEERRGYKLTDKGFENIYGHLTLDDTKKVVLDIFESYGIGKNEVLLDNNLITKRNQLNPYHRENFIDALEELAEEGLIEDCSKGVLLTEEGYEEIYG